MTTPTRLDNNALKHAVARLEKLYSSERYISSTDFVDAQHTYPSFVDLLSAFFHNPSSFIANASMRKKLRTLSNEATRQKHNTSIIKEAQQLPFEIEGRSLDLQQIEAVVVDEDAQLVMAAAGSGKTLSLLGKCKYLVNELGVRPERILTISFTKASADELATRLAKLGIAVDGKTFHALGNIILGKNTHVVSQIQQQSLIQDIIKNKTESDEHFARRYNDYILNYFSMPSPPIEAKDLEELVRNNRTFQTRTLKPISIRKHDYNKDGKTYHGEIVRSKEEQIIANFLYINSVSYEYEKPFPSYHNYRPDFTITQYNEPIYLEHQGVNRQGRTRPDIDYKYYQRKMKWNREYHSKGGTRLIETFSYEFQEGTILQNLETRLKEQGVEIIRRQESEIAQLIQRSYSNDVFEFNKLIITFLGLLKTSELTLSEIRARISNLENNYRHIRTNAFLTLFEEIYELYEATLRSTESIDFSDMIVSAADKLPSLPAGLMEYDYILVDEVQDLSGARYRLLKALLDRNPHSKLFAVGDDWQSIFRFAGSDLSLLSDFGQRFNRYTYHSVIEQTHRFNNPLLNSTTNFIRKNPSQIQKNPYSNSDFATQLTVNRSATADNDATVLDEELRKLLDTYGETTLSKQTIFLLGRYKRDVQRVLTYKDPRIQFNSLNDTDTRIKWTDLRTGVSLTLTFMTMHSSKGLTSEHTFILNGNGGSMGIPAERDDDPVLHILLAHEDVFPNAEERRLFYVALTRAKFSTTIICTDHNPSPFIGELQLPETSTIHINTEPRCPSCRSGYLIQREGPYGKFYGCTNFGYGCSYSSTSI